MSATPEAVALAGGLHLASPAALGSYLGRGTYQRARHIDYISRKLVEVAFGDIRFLMIMCPPRHSKSETCCKWFPSWLLALRPTWQVLLGCYGDEFAREWGSKVRNVMTENWPELGVTLSQDTKAGNLWRTKDGGGMQTAGVGGVMTGRGGQVLILDDPTKNAEEAQSETIQRRNWDWWLSTFRSRMTPKPEDGFQGAVVVIGTRWDQNDLQGRLLQAYEAGPDAEGYEPWTIIKFPAIASEPDEMGRLPGDALWPERFPVESFRSARNSTYWWASLYQQEPTPLGGDLLKEHWWGYWVPPGQLDAYPPVKVNGIECKVVELPEGLHEFESWDMNFKDEVRARQKGKDPDPVSGQVWGRDDADLYLLDREFGRFDLDETIQAVRALSARNPDAKAKLVEYTANGPAVIRALRREIGGFIPVTPVGSKVVRVIGNMAAGTTEADKGARAISAQAFVKGGNAFLPHPDLAPWSAEFRHNLGIFPKGGRDDTDAFSQAWAYAQSDIWKASDRAQNEASEHGNLPPARDIHELRQRQIQDSLRQETGEDEDGPRGRLSIYRRRRH